MNEEFKKVKDMYLEGCSIRNIASELYLSRTKVRKILISLALLESPLPPEAIQMRKNGMSLDEISKQLNISKATLSTYIPYDFETNKKQSADAKRAENYRERNKIAKDNMNKKGINTIIDKQQTTKLLKGSESMNFKENGITSKYLSNDEIKDIKVKDLYRLHLELVCQDLQVSDLLKKYGGVEYGQTITRDILVPCDLQLWALHYVIQRAFGWQNSHLHDFTLPMETLKKITDNKAGNWANMVGLVFRSPFMDEDARFWADDYEKGSFKNWLKKKYTGPTLSLCKEESFLYIIEHFKKYQTLDFIKDKDNFIDTHDLGKERNQEFTVEWYKNSQGKVFVCDCYPVKEENNRMKFQSEKSEKEVYQFKDLPLDALKYLFLYSYNELLERLPIGAILKPINNNDNRPLITQYNEFLDAAKNLNLDNLLEEPTLYNLTETLYYKYDYGDSWCVKVTASEDVQDLIKNKRITEEELKEAMLQCMKTYKPVMIARDGMDVCDDMGGISGLGNFINCIYETGGDCGMYEFGKKDAIEWAKHLGWSHRKIALKNRL